jgi:hypothetical protein
VRIRPFDLFLQGFGAGFPGHDKVLCVKIVFEYKIPDDAFPVDILFTARSFVDDKQCFLPAVGLLHYRGMIFSG